jgi:GGDEF domain-containing protein
MGITEARKYIQDLHIRQDNPYLWPDFLTGLPDKAAIINKLDEVMPELGKYAVAYVRICNIQPYLVKYGHTKHAEIIQWAAAVLKSTSEKYKKSFVGVMNRHDFFVACMAKDMPALIKEAEKLFKKRVDTFYNREDLKNKTAISFSKGKGKKLEIGLMKFGSVIAAKRLTENKGDLIRSMESVCEGMERSGKNMLVLDKFVTN